MSELLLAQSLLSIVLHDLSGTVGAIYNCSDLLDSYDPEIQSSAHELIAKNSQVLFDRIRIYKQAYGASKIEELSTILELVLKYFSQSNIKISIAPEVAEHKDIFQLILCLIISGKKILTNSGKISVFLDHNDNCKITILSNDNLKYEKLKQEILTKNKLSRVFDVKYAREHYIAQIAKRDNISISIDISDKSIEYTLKKRMI
jgi:hypothetical protein